MGGWVAMWAIKSPPTTTEAVYTAPSTKMIFLPVVGQHAQFHVRLHDVGYSFIYLLFNYSSSHTQWDEGESCTSHLPMFKFVPYNIVVNSFETCPTTLVGVD